MAVHPYSPNVKGIGYQLRRARQVMAEWDKKTKMFLTELGWGSGSGNSPLYKGPAGQAGLLSASFKFALKNRKRFKLANLDWFSWRDSTRTRPATASSARASGCSARTPARSLPTAPTPALPGGAARGSRSD